MRPRTAAVGLLLLAALVWASVASGAVELDFFDGMWVNNDTEINLVFQTGSEIDHFFFDLWRSESNLPIVAGDIDRSRASRVNTRPILNPNGVCVTTGQLYQFIDTTIDPSVDTYYYYLESHNCADRGSEMNGDGSGGLAVSRPTATPGPTPGPLLPRLRLPLLSR